MGDLHEFFADEFACALLMPPRELLIRIEQGWSIPVLGAHFDVPAPRVRHWVARLARHPPEHCTDLQRRLLHALVNGEPGRHMTITRERTSP